MSRALRTLSYTEPSNQSDVLKHEYATDLCRETETVISGVGVFSHGHVAGRITKGSASSAAKTGGNTGNGTCTLDGTTPVLPGSIPGIYTARCLVAVTNGGMFEVKNPNGAVIGHAVVGTAFAKDIKFTIADGSTDFAVGDGFDITIAVGSGKIGLYNPAAVNGLETAVGLLLSHGDATAADFAGAILLARGPAVVSRLGLKWGAGVTTTQQQDAAIAALAALNIITRSGA